MSHRNLMLLLVAMGFSLLCYQRGGQNPYARYIMEGYRKIDRYALDEVPDRELFEGAMKGMVDVLKEHGDPHSQFLVQHKARLTGDELSQEFGGIGVTLDFQDDPPRFLVSLPPLPGRPADRAGIQQGDQIVEIDGMSTAGLDRNNFADILARMRGKPSKPLTLKIVRSGSTEPTTIVVTRELITIPSIEGDRPLGQMEWEFTLEEDPRIALVRLSSFGDKTVVEIKDVLPRLLDEGVEAILLDMRGNPGGRLDTAVEVCELFLPAGEMIVETHRRGGEVVEVVRSMADGPFASLPVVVLVDRQSASASELVAGCLKDTGRAVVCGERTFGKGTVQQLLYMQAGQSMLKLTSASFWTKGMQPIQRRGDAAQWGVDPSPGMEVELTEEQYLDWLRARRQRDRGFAPSAADDTEPEILYRDEVVERAVAHLQEQLQ